MNKKYFLLLLICFIFTLNSCSDTVSQEEKCKLPYIVKLEKYEFDMGIYPNGPEERALDFTNLKLKGVDTSITKKYGYVYDFTFKITNISDDDTLFMTFKEQELRINSDTLKSDSLPEFHTTLAPKADTTIMIRYVFSGNKIAPNTMKLMGEESEKEFDFANQIQTSSSKNNPCADLNWNLNSHTFKEKKESKPLTAEQRTIVNIIINVMGAVFK